MSVRIISSDVLGMTPRMGDGNLLTQGFMDSEWLLHNGIPLEGELQDSQDPMFNKCGLLPESSEPSSKPENKRPRALAMYLPLFHCNEA